MLLGRCGLILPPRSFASAWASQGARKASGRQSAADRSSASAKDGKLRIPPSEAPPPSPDHGWVSPADTLSNLRTLVLPVRPDETPAERAYRAALDKVQSWNNTYWRQQNMQFVKAREDFIAQRCKESGLPESSLNAEDMAVFYKDFLDTRYRQHATYNRNWYRHNCELVWLALRAACSRTLVRRFKSSSSSSSVSTR